MSFSPSSFTLAGRRYCVPEWLAHRPLVVVCLDGCDPAYLRAFTGGRLFASTVKERTNAATERKSNNNNKNSADVAATGFEKNFTALPGQCVMPSFTNPNNISIITGVPPSQHGICGNYFFNSSKQKDEPMTQEEFIFPLTVSFLSTNRDGATTATMKQQRATILSLLSSVQVKMPAASASTSPPGSRALRVGAITSKNKLLKLLCTGLAEDDPNRKFFFSVESLSKVDMYSAEASFHVFLEAIKLQQKNSQSRCDVLYLSTTDYIQHKHSSQEKEAMQFYHEIDRLLSVLRDELGCVVCVTADHGMSAKPRLLFLGDELVKARFSRDAFHVVLPITDPYVAHHAALGSYAVVYLRWAEQQARQQQEPQATGGGRGTAEAKEYAIELMMKHLQALRGVKQVLRRDAACSLLALPTEGERLGDLVLIAHEDTAFGSFEAFHDLSQLKNIPLRSHGGQSEQDVPLLLDNRLLVAASAQPATPLHNYDVFHMALNSKMKQSHL